MERNGEDSEARLAFLLEEIGQQSEALVAQHARFGFRLGMEHRAEAREAVFRVVGGTNHLADVGVAQGSGAHGARLQGNIERTLVQVFGTQGVGRSSNGEHLGVGGYIVEGFGLVVRPRNDFVVAHHHRPDGDFVGLYGGLRLLEGLLHVVFVGEN